ncbi:MAG TPA: hypothetical protein VG057_05845 [Solirubrobacteraceae bacterium]|nr:hypothetical protein [Solirubrobacteraceae bacterium]
MPEGLSAAEVGKEIAEHKKHAEHAEHGEHEPSERHERWLSIIEAVVLSVVAVIAAYSGFAAAKWSTESSVSLARASALRTKASRADLEALQTRTLDSVSFNAWFTAFVAGNKRAEQLAQNRLRPGYRPAFNAWLATDPAHNPNAPPGPSYMPQYVIPQETQANELDTQADAEFTKGSDAGGTADKYVRDTVFLATVLFLIGISGHLKLRQARMGLVSIGLILLVFSVIQLAGLPAPP